MSRIWGNAASNREASILAEPMPAEQMTRTRWGKFPCLRSSAAPKCMATNPTSSSGTSSSTNTFSMPRFTRSKSAG